MSTSPPLAATLLIVDDVPANLGVVVDSLDEHGLRVLVAQDGEEGLRRAALVRPDLILLDVMMPGIDGFEVCRRLKADAATRDIPVIFMTALADTANKLAGFAAGGVDYVTKPFDTTEVLARVSTHLALRAAQAQLAARNLQLQQSFDELQGAQRRLDDVQAQLLQSEKMAAVGLLAAGVAHEINNPIGFVSSNIFSLERYVVELIAVIAAYAPADEVLARAAPHLLETIRAAREHAELDYLKEDLIALIGESKDGLARVKKIVEDLKDFSHVGESAWQFAGLNEELESTLNIVAHEIKYKATLTKEYGTLPDIECVPSELNQVFMNLLVNAAQAIAEHGAIHLRTGADAEEVWVEIADSGSGIAPEHLTHIFDPFFTTKPVGVGTGLGLALSYATVQKHHGRIDVASVPGRGTTFHIRLPLRQPHSDPTQDAVAQRRISP